MKRCRFPDTPLWESLRHQQKGLQMTCTIVDVISHPILYRYPKPGDVRRQGCPGEPQPSPSRHATPAVQSLVAVRSPKHNSFRCGPRCKFPVAFPGNNSCPPPPCNAAITQRISCCSNSKDDDWLPGPLPEQFPVVCAPKWTKQTLQPHRDLSTAATPKRENMATDDGLVEGLPTRNQRVSGKCKDELCEETIRHLRAPALAFREQGCLRSCRSRPGFRCCRRQLVR